MKLTLTKRAGGTKGDAKKIRREGNIPAVFYAKGHAVEQVVVPGAEFQAILRSLKQDQLSTRTFALSYEGKTHKAIIKDIQYHPATYAIEHIDFVMLFDHQPVTVSVPLEITGAAECEGIKLGGTLRQVIRKLKVSCLPKDIPHRFEIDVRDLGIAQSKRLGDISMPANVRSLMPMKEVAVVVAKGKVSA